MLVTFTYTMEDLEKDYMSVVGELYSDYDIGGNEVPTPPFQFADKKITYAQNEISKVSCTLHSAITCLSNLVGYVFTLEERKALWEQAIKLGAREAFGWSGSGAIDLVRNYWNKNHDKKITSFRVDLRGEEAKTMLESGYMIQVGFRGNSIWSKDKSDGILDGVEFGASTYGHFVSLFKEDGKYKICDNYPSGKTNIYELAHFENIKGFYPNAYVFVVTDSYNKANEFKQIATWAEKSKEKAIKAGVITDWKNPQEKVGGEKMEYILENLKLLDKSKHEGYVTLEQFSVVLDRLNLLK